MDGMINRIAQHSQYGMASSRPRAYIILNILLVFASSVGVVVFDALVFACWLGAVVEEGRRVGDVGGFVVYGRRILTDFAE